MSADTNVSDRLATLLSRHLPVVAELSTLPVPRPTLVDPEAGVLGYPKLPSRPLNLQPSPIPHGWPPRWASSSAACTWRRRRSWRHWYLGIPIR